MQSQDYEPLLRCAARLHTWAALCTSSHSFVLAASFCRERLTSALASALIASCSAAYFRTCTIRVTEPRLLLRVDFR